jgi:hypothetical protein
MPDPSTLWRALDGPAARLAGSSLGVLLIAAWWWGDRRLRGPVDPGFDPMWLAFVGIAVLVLALLWAWNAVFSGRRDPSGLALSVVGLLVCSTGAVLVGAFGLVIELFLRAENADSVTRIALRALWHGALAFCFLAVLSPITLRLLGSLPNRDGR